MADRKVGGWTGKQWKEGFVQALKEVRDIPKTSYYQPYEKAQIRAKRQQAVRHVGKLVRGVPRAMRKPDRKPVRHSGVRG